MLCPHFVGLFKIQSLGEIRYFTCVCNVIRESSLQKSPVVMHVLEISH